MVWLFKGPPPNETFIVPGEKGEADKVYKIGDAVPGIDKKIAAHYARWAGVAFEEVKDGETVTAASAGQAPATPVDPPVPAETAAKGKPAAKND